MAFYQERTVKPRPLNDSARLSLLFWSQWFDWRNALVIVKPETFIGWHKRAFQIFWRWKSRGGGLIHDWSGIFSEDLDHDVKTFGVAVLKTPIRAPKANAYCERLIGSLRREYFGLVHSLERATCALLAREWAVHYNQGRPHKS